MSVSSPVARVAYTIASLPAVLPSVFEFNSSADLLVLDGGASNVGRVPVAVLTLNSDYTVSGGGYDALNQLQTGTITIVSGGGGDVQVGDVITILRNIDPVQDTTFASTGQMTPLMIEQDDDKLTTLVQQILDESRLALKFPLNDFFPSDIAMPARSDKLLGFTLGGDIDLSNSVGSIIAAAVATAVSDVAARLAIGGAPYLNVKAYGATGDGVTDDTTAIQNALDFAASLGQVVFLPAGNYVHSGLTIYTNSSLLGEGPSSVLITKAGSNADALTTYDANALFGTNSNGGVSGVLLQDFVIEGNKATQASGRGLVAYWYNSEMRRVIIRNTKDLGIKEEWGPGGVPVPNIVMENSYTDVAVVAPDSATDGWYHNGPHDSRFYGCSTVECIGFAGWRVGANGTGAMFVNCHPFGYIQIGRSPSWQVVFDGSGCMWCNSTAEGGSVGQILIRATECQVLGGFQYNIATAYNQIGIQIGDTAHGFTGITGTVVRTRCTNFYNGAIVFNSTGGLDDITITGYNVTAGSTVYSGSYANSTRIFVNISGPGAGVLHREPSAVTYLDSVTTMAATAAQFPNPGITVAETFHASSKRAVAQIGNNWQLIQDFAGNGTKDFSIFKVTVGGRTQVLKFDTDGNIILLALPSSAAGLPSGALWNNSGVINIAP